MSECRHGLSEDCPGCMQETIDALTAEVAELKRHAQRAPEGREELIESIAKWLHDETDDPDSFPGYVWPLHDNDTGQRGGRLWVHLVPIDVIEKFRATARRLVTRYASNFSAVTSKDGDGK